MFLNLRKANLVLVNPKPPLKSRDTPLYGECIVIYIIGVRHEKDDSNSTYHGYRNILNRLS